MFNLKLLRRLLFSLACLVSLAGATVNVPVGGAAAGRFPPIKFDVPAQLPSVHAGKPYSFSFCEPAANGRCGGPGHVNPTGGFNQYYSFGPLFYGGLPYPPGLRLNRSTGLLSGTVHENAKPRVYHFRVCAGDAVRSLTASRQETCRSTSITVLPPQVDLSGTWTGTFTAAAGANACGSNASGTAALVLAQDDANVTGNLNYTVTGFTPNPDAPDDCANLSPVGAIPIDANVNGNSVAGGGFSLTLQKTQAGAQLSGTFVGVVQGIPVTVTIRVGK